MVAFVLFTTDSRSAQLPSRLLRVRLKADCTGRSTSAPSLKQEEEKRVLNKQAWKM